MKVSEIMTREVHMTPPDAPIVEAARQMAQHHVGFLPVATRERLVGAITDRDIVVRCVAKGTMDGATVRDVMTSEVMYCFEDDDIEKVAQNMGNIQVRRLPVVNREKRLVGVVSFADVAVDHGGETVAVALSGIARPGGLHAT